MARNITVYFGRHTSPIAERGLAFRESSNKVGDPNNGHFLGSLELLSKQQGT